MTSSVPLEFRAASPVAAGRQAPSPLDKETCESPLLERGGTPRLKGTMIVTTPEAPMANAFKQCPDFAKINNEAHNSLRTDTFGTPTSLHSRYHTPSRLDKKRAMDDPAEFQRWMKKAVHEMQVVQKEQQESMETLRGNMTNSLEEHASAKDTLERIQEHTLVLEEKSREPLDLSSVHAELQSVRNIALERQEQMEGRLIGQMKEMLEEIHNVRQQQEKAEKEILVQIHEEIFNVRLVADVRDVVHRSETQLADVLQLTRSLSADSSLTSQNVQEMQRDHRLHHAQLVRELGTLVEETREHVNGFVPTMQSQLTSYLRHNPVNVNFDEVLSAMSRTRHTVQVGFEQLLNEIARVQQALNVDFARVMDDMGDMMRKSLADNLIGAQEAIQSMAEGHEKSHRKSYGRVALAMGTAATEGGLSSSRSLVRTGSSVGRKAVRRYRNTCTQTENVEAEDVWTQTDDEMWKAALKGRKPKKDRGKATALHSRKIETDAFQKALITHQSQHGKKIFQDAESMKHQVRSQLMQPQYNVHDYYWKTGCSQAIASSPSFEQFTLFVILLNVIWIGVDTDHNDKDILIDAHPVFQVAENIFCIFFSIELLIRFLAFRRKRYCLQDFWFVFDAALVLLMIAETWILSIVILSIGNRPEEVFGGLSILRICRFARVVRVSRLARVLRAIPEIVILLKGILVALRSVFVFFMLWFVMIYVFAILFRQITNENDVGRQYFSTVPAAMNTLLLGGLLPENEDLVNAVAASNPLYWILMMAFIMMASLTLMHMLVGVLVETISIISVAEREGMAVTSVSSQLRYMMVTLDYDPATDVLTKSDFQQFIMEPGVARIFRSEGVDTNVMIDMAEIIFQDLESTGSGGLTFEMLVEIVLNMRGSNPATVKDVEKQLRLIKSVIRDSMSLMYSTFATDLEAAKTDILHLVESLAHGDKDSEDSGELHRVFTPEASITLLDAEAAQAAPASDPRWCC